MISYFERSQGVRREIEMQPEILDRIRCHMRNEKRMELAGPKGSSNKIYRIGKLNSGLHVALRNMAELDQYVKNEGAWLYNSYCEEVAEKYEHGGRVPSFAIGGFVDDIPLLVVEDLSEGGEWQVIPTRGGGNAQGVRKKGEIQEEIAYDFGFDFITDVPEEYRADPEGFRSLKYFANESVLQL